MSANNNATEPGMFFILLLVVLFIAGFVIWHFFKIPILETLRYLRVIEIWPLSFIDGSFSSCVDWLLHTHPDDKNPSDDIVRWTNQCFGSRYLSVIPRKDQIDYFMLSAPAMAVIEERATYYWRWPIAAAFGVLATYIMYFSPRGKFRTRHTLESFINFQAKMWPVISPIVKFNPIKSSSRSPGAMVPDKLPLFAEALSPEEWVAFHRIPVTNGIADKEATRRALLLQLGPRWNGIEGQPDHVRALFVAYSLKGIQKREESDDLLGKIAECWSDKEGLKLTSDVAAIVKKSLRDPEIGGKGLEIAQNHAWRTTAMIGVLRWGRTFGGVLAPAQFLWLRGVDRNLWYALNNLGRRSFHSEGAGAMAHFMAEQNAGKALPIPRIDTAIVTLNQYLSGENARPIPQRENANKRA